MRPYPVLLVRSSRLHGKIALSKKAGKEDLYTGCHTGIVQSVCRSCVRAQSFQIVVMAASLSSADLAVPRPQSRTGYFRKTSLSPVNELLLLVCA